MVLRKKMTHQPPPQRPSPPPVSPLEYGSPGSQPRPAEADSATRVFDTVTGPNIRLKDNLLQLAAVLVGTAIGIGIGRAMAPTEGDHRFYMMLGALLGLIVSVMVSGLVIGIIRGRRTPKR